MPPAPELPKLAEPKIELPPLEGSYYVMVTCITGGTFHQDANMDETVAILKARLRQHEGGALEGKKFRLVFEGKDLPATGVLAELGVKKGSTLHAVLLRADIGEEELPEAGGRVHFSGALLLDHAVTGQCSVPYEEDTYSEYVGVGKYPDNEKAFPKAISASFDSVAVDAGTRVTIYSEKGFKGTVLWDKIGPAIVANTKWQTLVLNGDTQPYSTRLSGSWKEPFQTIFPPEVREFSSTDMHLWRSGSLVVTGGMPIPPGAHRLAEYVKS